VAERTVADEEIMTSVNRQINKFSTQYQSGMNLMQERSQQLESKIDKSYEALVMKVENNQIRIDSNMEEAQLIMNQQNEHIHLIN